jgi:hypothetical protein
MRSARAYIHGCVVVGPEDPELSSTDMAVGVD